MNINSSNIRIRIKLFIVRCVVTVYSMSSCLKCEPDFIKVESVFYSRLEDGTAGSLTSILKN